MNNMAAIIVYKQGSQRSLKVFKQFGFFFPRPGKFLKTKFGFKSFEI